jgi:hypothetical protein
VPARAGSKSLETCLRRAIAYDGLATVTESAMRAACSKRRDGEPVSSLDVDAGNQSACGSVVSDPSIMSIIRYTGLSVSQRRLDLIRSKSSLTPTRSRSGDACARSARSVLVWNL